MIINVSCVEVAKNIQFAELVHVAVQVSLEPDSLLDRYCAIDEHPDKLPRNAPELREPDIDGIGLSHHSYLNSILNNLGKLFFKKYR